MIGLALLLIATLVVQSSFIMALGEPFHLISLPLLIGTLVLHRMGLYYGIAWFALVAVLQWIFGFSLFSFWIYPIIAAGAGFLVLRLFTKHSTYAFIGLYSTVLTGAFVLQWIGNWSVHVSAWVTGMLFAIPMSYAVVVIARAIENLSKQFLFDRT